jgi:putative acetyltransferase
VTIALRPMLPADGPILAVLFRASIQELTDEDYDEGQREAWIAGAEDEEAFGARLQAGLTLVATVRGAPVGFITLMGTDHIEMLYVHPGAARQGVGSQLYGAIEKLAAARGAKRLTVDASDTAKPFFDAMGFEARHRHTVTLGDEWLGQTRMEKAIGATPPQRPS